MRTLLVVALSLAAAPRAFADEPITYRPLPPAPPAPPPEQPMDRTPAYVATGIAGAALLGTVVCYLEFNAASDRAGRSEPGRLGTDAQAKLTAAYDDVDSWRTRGLAMGGLTIVGAVVAGYFWGETTTKAPRVDLHPTTGGAAMSLSGRF